MTLRLTLALALLLLLAPAARAGVVDVDMQDGTLTVEGSETADAVTVSRSAEGLVVTPGAGTGTDVASGSGCIRDAATQVVTCPGAEDAVLRGNGGDDRLAGGDEDDVLNGGAGADDLRGGGGTDRVRFPGALAQHVSLDDAADDGASGEGDNAHADVEDVQTGAGADEITGSAAANDIVSRGGEDAIDPGPGADRVRAGAGDDRVRTRDDRTDAIACGDGDDRLVSDPGDDGESCERTDSTIPATAPDTQSPAITLAVDASIPANRMRLGVPVTLTSDEPVTAEIEIIGYSTRARVARAGDFVLASHTTRALVGSRTVTVSIARRRLRMIRRRAKLTVRVTATDAAANLTVVAGTFRVR